MKVLRVLTLITTVFLGGCDSKISKSAASPDSANELHQDAWQPITKNLKEYSTEDPERPIIAHIWADWDLTGTLPHRTLRSPEVTNAFVSAGFLCLEGDVTSSAPLLLEQIRSLNRQAPPMTAIFQPASQEWEVMPEVFTAQDAIRWAH